MSTIYLDNAATTKVRKEVVSTISSIIKSLSTKYNQNLNVGICHPGSID